MIGLAYLLMFIVIWFVVSIIAVWYLSRKKNKYLKKRRNRIIIFFLIFLLPFSMDILTSLYMNITLGLYCSGSSGILKKVNDRPSSFLVKVGAIEYLYEKDVQFVEWHLNDRYSRSRRFSPDIPEGLYKAFLRPNGDPDCESVAVFFPDPEIRKKLYNGFRVKSRSLDKCVVIVKVDRLMAKYQVGEITYTEKTLFGYSVRVDDKYITDVKTGGKIGLYRQISGSWALPFIDFIVVNTDPHMRGGGGGGCGYKTRPSYYYWQDIFQYEEGEE